MQYACVLLFKLALHGIGFDITCFMLCFYRMMHVCVTSNEKHCHSEGNETKGNQSYLESVTQLISNVYR